MCMSVCAVFGCVCMCAYVGYCCERRVCATDVNVDDALGAGLQALHCSTLGLARTVCIYTVYDRTLGDFPAKNTVYTPYTYGSGQPFSTQTPLQNRFFLHCCVPLKMWTRATYLHSHS